MFYQSVVACVIFFAAVCWGGGIRSSGAINKLVRKASSVMGMKLDSVEVVTERRMRKAVSYNGQSFSSSLRRAEATQEHVKPHSSNHQRWGSFVPSAIRLHNSVTCEFLPRGLNKGTSYLFVYSLIRKTQGTTTQDSCLLTVRTSHMTLFWLTNPCVGVCTQWPTQTQLLHIMLFHNY